jgi:hypothetical protein
LPLTTRRRRLSAPWRHSLLLLASSHSGITETLLFAHGVTPHMLDRLLRGKLATMRRETIKSGDETIELGRVMITDAGRRATRNVALELNDRVSFPEHRRRGRASFTL